LLAAVIHGPKDVRLEEIKKPQPEDEEVLIRVNAAGICGSDIHIWKGNLEVHYPLVPGHECCGHVVQVSERDTTLKEGDRVVIQPNFGCTSCYLCRMGKDNLCPSKVRLGVDIDGCFAEYVKAPARYVWPIPDEISDQQGAMVEPLAVAVRAVRKMGNPLGKRVLLLGGGPIGLLTLQLAKQTGAAVILADLVEERLALGRKLGAREVLDVNKCDLAKRVMWLTKGEGIDVVIEAAGATQTIELAIEVVRPGGMIVLVGLPHGTVRIPPTRIVRKEIEIQGSIIYSYDDFRQSIWLIREGMIDVDSLITHKFPLKEIGKAFDVLTTARKGIKVIVKP